MNWYEALARCVKCGNTWHFARPEDQVESLERHREETRRQVDGGLMLCHACGGRLEMAE